jgi:hypothetical protein
VLRPYDLYQDTEVKAPKTFTLDFDSTRQHKTGSVSVFFDVRPEKVSGKDEKAAFGPLDQRSDNANEMDAALTFTFDNQGGRVQAWSYGLKVGPAVDKAYVDTAGSVGTNHARVVAFAPEGFLPGRKATFELYVDGCAVSTLATTLDGGPSTFGFSFNQGTISGGAASSTI